MFFLKKSVKNNCVQIVLCTEDEYEEDDDGQIDIMELRAFRDDDRKLHGKGVPEFIHKTDERFAGLSKEQQNHPDTVRRGGYQETADDKKYANLYQRHVVELKDIAVPEVLRQDCLYGFNATDEEIDGMTLAADADVRPLQPTCCCSPVDTFPSAHRERAGLTTLSLLR